MKNSKLLLVAALATVVGFASCSDDDSETPVNDLKVTVTMPLTIQDAQLVNGTLTATNQATSKVYTQDTIVSNSLTLRSLPVGVYSLVFEGRVQYTIASGEKTYASVKQTMDNYAVTQSATNVANTETLALEIYNAKEGLLLTEIFFTGTTTPEGKQYSEDQYFKVGNNSDDTLYLDGVAFVESAFMTVDKQDYTPDLMADALSIDAIYVFPGNGQDHPIAPGEEKLVAVNAIDHTEANPNSFDLTVADFEIYDESSNPNITDTDEQSVTNMINWYDYSYTYFIMHNRGFKAYALVKPEVKTQDEFLAGYHYEYTYVFRFGEYAFDMDGDAYFIPNTWVIDAVNLSVADSYEWQVTSETLDAGWAHCGEVDRDQNRYNKSVIRKKSGTKWVDTNNSANDFESDAKASMLK